MARSRQNAKSSSRLIAQLWNGRVSDRIEIDRRTEQFNRLVETHNVEVERTLSQAASTSEKKEQVAGKLTRSVRNLADTPKLPSPLLLQRRVEASQNSEQNLKQRLNQMAVLLDQGRRRNATLKGA